MTLDGGVDEFDRFGIRGWVRAMERADYRVVLSVITNGEVMASVRADLYRSDLENAGIGDGEYGFVVDLQDLSPYLSHTIELVHELDGSVVPGSPIFIEQAKTLDPGRPAHPADDRVETDETDLMPPPEVERDGDFAAIRQDESFIDYSTKLDEPADASGQNAEDIERPRFDEVGDNFFEELYLALNPDATEAIRSGMVVSAYEHWLSVGSNDPSYVDDLRNTLRFGKPAQSLLDLRSDPLNPTAGFNAFGYLYTNPDVRRHTNGTSNAALSHWVENGRAEGRIAPGVLRRDFRFVDLRAMLSRPLGINIFGPLATASGLGTAARAMAKAVKASGLEFELNTFDFSSGELRPAIEAGRKYPKYRINLLLANADLIARVFASYPVGYFDNAYNIAVWQWELASPRTDAYFAFEGVDEVWTNSAFQADSIGAITPVPVQVIHLPVVAPKAKITPQRARFGIPENDFVFYMPFDVGSTSARKNPFAVIAAFKRLQQERQDIHLVLKYHSARYEQNFIQDLLLAVSGSPSITVNSTKLPLGELDKLRAACDCLVSAHRSEGFGLNIAEFLSLGKPVIATNYSGNLDFFDEQVGFPVDFTLVELTKQLGPYHPGFIWAEPSSESLFQQMRRVLGDPEEVERRGTAAVAKIADLLSLETVGHTIARRIAELEFDAPLPAFARGLGQADRAIKQLNGASSSRRITSESLSQRPLLSIVVPVYNVPPEYLRACIDSVNAQTYPYWELCICDDCSTNEATLRVLEDVRGSSPAIKIVKNAINGGISDATNKALHIATGDFVIFLDNDDLLEPNALEEVARAIAADPQVDVIYSDEIKIDADGYQIDHFYKPDWSPEHLESVMYVLHLFVVRKRLLIELGGLRTEFTGAQDYDLMLRCSRATTRIHHIRKSLYRWRAIPGSAAAVVDAKPTALQNGMRALADHALQKYGPLARVEPGLLTGTFRLRRILRSQPPISLLILTGNVYLELPGRGEVCLVENMVRSILEKTDYPDFKIVVVDNSRLSSAQVSRFEELGAQVINYLDSGPFNYAAKANFALRMATTDNIVLMNDDMEVIRPDWLTSLVELSTDPGIGAVGARLLHLDGSIQHVGTVLGVNGSAAHPYHSYPRDFVGYNGYTHIIRNYSAVTAACLATRRSGVAQVGWFDENLAIDFNDIDFCLKVIQAGYRIALHNLR